MNESQPPKSSMTLVWVGRVLSALPVLALTMSGVMKLLQPKELVDGFQKFGYSLDLAAPIGIVELICTLLYAIPQTAVLGAILLTGYLGGAVATHVRVGDPVSQWLPPVVLGVILWTGLYLRDSRIRELAPWRRLS